MSKQKIKLLMTNRDSAGVLYWRTNSPALCIDTYHNDEFEVELNQNVNWDDYEYLKKFDIIHSHRQFCDYVKNKEFFDFCNKEGIVTILDLDDFPDLHKGHSMYQQVMMDRLHLKTYDTLRLCDGVTTTTEYFANILRKYNDNVIDLQNAINTDIMPQFRFNRKPSTSNRIVFSYVGGSSHKEDIEQLKDMFDIVASNPDLADKIQFTLHGFDARGGVNALSLNPELIKEIHGRGLNINQVLIDFNKCNGDINKLSIPEDLKNKYRNGFVINTQRNISIKESVWFTYESIFTSNYKLIRDKKYLEYLLKYTNEPYIAEEGEIPEKNQVYRRIWTKGINQYATHYDETEVSLVPLVSGSEFNNCKSPLKICEATAKHCSVICSDNIIYTKYIKNKENGIVIKRKQDWIKAIKYLVNNPELITQYADQLREDTKDIFDLNLVTKKRIEWYKELYNKKKETKNILLSNQI